MLIPCNKIPNKKKSAIRKMPSDFSFVLYDDVSMINTEHWNSAAIYGSEFLQLSYLSVLEKEHPANMRFHYSIIYKAGKPFAVAYFQVIDFSSDSFSGTAAAQTDAFSCLVGGYLKKQVANHIMRNADKINMRLLICGNACISGEHGFAVIPQLDKTFAFDALADVIYSISRAEKLRGKIAAVLVKDFYAHSLPYSKELEEFSYHDFFVEPNMIVDIEWKSFDEYLNALSKKYRKRAKGIVNKGQNMERKTFSAADIIANKKEIVQLYTNVHHKARFRMATLTPAYFAELKKALNDRFVFTAYYYKGKMAGFRTSFILKNHIEAHFIGLDYELNKELEMYQNILYDYVNEAISNHKRQLHLGRTASEIKSSVGAKAHDLKCYIRHRNPLSNRIIKPFIDYLKPSEWIPRNPFKEEINEAEG